MDIASIHFALRITARISLLFFVWAFTAAALARLMPTPSTRWLEANLRNAVLVFATSHTVHLGFILTLAARMGWAQFIHTFTWVAVIVGGAAFLLIWGLAWKALHKRMSAIAEDTRFEAFAYYYVWFIFAVAYVGASLKTGFYIPFVFVVVVVVAALLLRLTAAWQS
jgi:hypothetical protein